MDEDLDEYIKCVELCEKIKKIANNVLYFDDNSDYATALWEILASINDWTEEECYTSRLRYIE